MGFLVLYSYEPDDAGCSCYLHFIDVGWGFERLSDLALDHSGEGPEARHKARSMCPEPVFAQIRGLHLLCSHVMWSM